MASVTLSDEADGYVVADAVKLIHQRPAGTGLYYVHTDHLGTPRALIDPETHQAVWDWRGAPFGESAPDEDPDGDGRPVVFPLRFPGQYFDAETGLHYNGFRDYEPGSGRYVQSDPIGLEGGVNTYIYTFNNPLSYVDPTGENPAAGAAVAGAAAIRICNRIPKCKTKLAELMKKAKDLCKSVDCTVRFDKKGHPFPSQSGGKELCMHWQVDCHIKGQKGSGFSIHSKLPICWKPGDPFPLPRPPILP